MVESIIRALEHAGWFNMDGVVATLKEEFDNEITSVEIDPEEIRISNTKKGLRRIIKRSEIE